MNNFFVLFLLVTGKSYISVERDVYVLVTSCDHKKILSTATRRKMTDDYLCSDQVELESSLNFSNKYRDINGRFQSPVSILDGYDNDYFT